MSALCLNDSLVSQYLKYTSNSEFDKRKVRNLLKYIQPFIVSKNQNPIFSDPSMPSQINNDPLLKIVDNMSYDDLVKTTILKLQLVDSIDTNSFTKVNIAPLSKNIEKVNMLISATYENALDKNKAISHIKALLSDAKWIMITDGYISNDTAQWNKNKKLLEKLLPKSKIGITIKTQNFRDKTDLINICDLWEVKSKGLDRKTIHDRYIETDKLKILLSSGLYNLSESSNKDITYTVKIK
jgi:hypothetical protein